MTHSLFERIGTADVAAWLTLLAVLAPIIGVSIGLAAGVRRRRIGQCVAIGLVWGAAGPFLLLAWSLVVSRTSFAARLAGEGPGHLLWGLFPPADYYAARERARYSPVDHLLRECRAPAAIAGPKTRAWWWALVPPDRLDDVANLASLGLLFALGGLAAGAAGGRLVRRIRAISPEPGSAPGVPKAHDPM